MLYGHLPCVGVSLLTFAGNPQLLGSLLCVSQAPTVAQAAKESHPEVAEDRCQRSGGDMAVVYYERLQIT